MHFQLLIWRELEMGCLVTECTPERSIALVSIAGVCLGIKHRLCLCSVCPDLLPCPLFTSSDICTGRKHLGSHARANLMLCVPAQRHYLRDLVKTCNTELLQPEVGCTVSVVMSVRAMFNLL